MSDILMHQDIDKGTMNSYVGWYVHNKLRHVMLFVAAAMFRVAVRSIGWYVNHRLIHAMLFVVAPRAIA